MKHWRQWLVNRQLQAAQALVEYALILIFVAVVLIAILMVLSPGLVNIYENIVDWLQ